MRPAIPRKEENDHQYINAIVGQVVKDSEANCSPFVYQRKSRDKEKKNKYPVVTISIETDIEITVFQFLSGNYLNRIVKNPTCFNVNVSIFPR